MSILTTSQLRRAWTPGCKGPWATMTFNGDGRASVRPATMPVWRAVNQCFIHHGRKVTMPDCGGFVCRGITLPSGGRDPNNLSLHAYGICCDLDWNDNPYSGSGRLHTNFELALVNDICAIRTNNGKQAVNWGGFYRNIKDPMHFEVVCSPADLLTGLNPHTIVGGGPVIDAWAWPAFPGNMSPTQGNGPSLKLLADKLTKAGLYHGPIDGRWHDGPEGSMSAAVRYLKKEHDGILFKGGVTDLSEYWGSYRDSVGTFDDGVGAKLWAYMSWRAKGRHEKP